MRHLSRNFKCRLLRRLLLPAELIDPQEKPSSRKLEASPRDIENTDDIEIREFTKGGFSKGGFSNLRVIIILLLQNPPILNPPL